MLMDRDDALNLFAVTNLLSPNVSILGRAQAHAGPKSGCRASPVSRVTRRELGRTCVPANGVLGTKQSKLALTRDLTQWPVTATCRWRGWGTCVRR